MPCHAKLSPSDWPTRSLPLWNNCTVSPPSSLAGLYIRMALLKTCLQDSLLARQRPGYLGE